MTDFHSANDNEEKFNKIGGWLVLCAIGLVFYPVQTMVSVVTELIPAFSHASWTTLTSPAGPAYHPLWAPLVIGELAGSLCFLVFSIGLVVMFFQRRKYFPKFIILFLITNILFVSLDYFLTHFIVMRVSSINMDATINFVRTAVAGIIWIPYFTYSKRVKRTFIN